MVPPYTRKMARDRSNNQDIPSGFTYRFASLGRSTTSLSCSFRPEAAAMVSLENLATDCLRFSMYFFHPIQQCAQHIYHTALPLSPMSSELHKTCLQTVIDNQLSHVTTFTGAPGTWGLLLRTIILWPRQPTCIATSAQMIVAACGEIVNIYDAVTPVVQQSIHAPETVAKIQGSPDGFILFFAHSLSVTMWDVQTGGLIHTFTTQSQINDVAVSTTGDYLACGLSSGSIIFWNTQSKEEGTSSGNGQPVVTTYWISPEELSVATKNTIYIHSITAGETLDSLPITGCVWGMVFVEHWRKHGSLTRVLPPKGGVYQEESHIVELQGKSRFLVGTLQSSSGVGQEESHFVVVKWMPPHGLRPGKLRQAKRQSPTTHTGQLSSPVLIGDNVVCITPPNGIQVMHTYNHHTNYPPLLDAATFMAGLMNRNLVVQTKGSIQIFSTKVLEENHKASNDADPSHIYPLGEKHIICVLQPTRCLTLLELETLEKVHPDDTTPALKSSLINSLATTHGLVSHFGIPMIMETWQSGTPLPGWTETAEEDMLLHVLSPEHTRIVTISNSPRWELCVKHVGDGITLANLPLEDTDLEMGEVYDVTFDSETRFHLKVDGPGQHIQIPFNVAASPLGDYSHTITKGESVNLSEPRATPPYTLDKDCEWVLDRESRKICWISPENLRRGNGGHFWAGLSLIMVGDDGEVRKVTFKQPDC